MSSQLKGMRTTAGSFRRDHVEGFIAAELERTAPSPAAIRYRSLQQLFRWVGEEGEIDSSPTAETRPPISPEQRVPVLDDDRVRKLLDSCAGHDFRNRRDTASACIVLPPAHPEK